MRKLRIWLPLVFAALLGMAVPAAVAAPAQAAPDDQTRVEHYLNSIRHDPDQLRSFLLNFPKGGDLHSHLSGAVSTELLIALAARDGLCINTTTFVAAGGRAAPVSAPRRTPRPTRRSTRPC